MRWWLVGGVVYLIAAGWLWWGYRHPMTEEEWLNRNREGM